MPASNFLANEILDHMLGTGSWTMPTNVYLALYTAAPTAAGGGTQVSATNGYARQQTAFAAASSRSAANSAIETFTASGGNWGTVTHWGIFDASTSGNMLHWGELVDSNGDPAPQLINDGDSISFPIGAVVISSPLPA